MPPTNPEMTKKLREIFYRPGLTIVPGGSTPYHAMLTERAGYEAFYMSGSMTSGWTIGWPDVGVISMEGDGRQCRKNRKDGQHPRLCRHRHRLRQTR